MEDNKRKLYDALSAEYDLGTFEQFSTDIQDADKRKKLYDATINDYDFGDYDSFSSQLGFSPAQEGPTPQATNEPYGFGKPVYSQAPNHVEGDIYKHGDSYTRTEIPYRTVEYPTLGEAQEAEKAKQREEVLAAYRSAYNRLEAPGEVDEKTLIEWGNNMENAPIEQKNLYTRIMGQDATNRVDLDAVMRSYDETRKSLEGVEDPEGLAVYLMMPDERKAKLPEDERSRYEGLIKDKRKADVVDDVNELHERISSLMEQQRVSDIKMHRDYLENRSTGQAIKDAILGIPVAETPQLQGVVPSSGYDLTPEGKLSNEQNAALTAAGRRWNEMKYLINAAQNGDLFGGLDKALGSIDTWTSDQMLRDNMAIMRVANKYDEEGEKSLTDNERALLDALALNVAVSEMYGDEISNWYKGGEMIGEMVPFIIEMLMNPLAGLGKKAADKVTRKAIEKYGKEIVKKNAKKFALTRGAAKLGTSVAGATGMALTTGLPAVGADIQKRMLGDATYGYDDEDNIEYTGHVGGEDLGTSAYKAVTSRMLDNVSEMLGAEYANLPLKWLQKAGKGTKLLGWIDNLANSKFGKGVSRFAEKTKWNGPIEEFLEEVHVGLINPVLVGDQSWEEFFTKDNLATIAIGVAVPGAAISTANTIAGAADGAFKVGAQERWKMQNAEAMGYQLWQDNPNEWNDLTRSLMVGQMEDVEKTLKEVYNNPKLTPEQKKVALEYAVYSLQWRTAQGVKEAFNEGKKFIDPMLRDIYGTAYAEEVSPVQANDAYKAMVEAEKKAQRVLGIGEESVDEWLNGRSAEEVTNDAAQQEAIKAYQAAKLDFEGRRDRYIAEKERAYMESDKSIQANDNNGMVYATQLKDEPVFITGGNVVLNEDGTIDVDNSSETLYVKFPDGHVEMTSPDKFTEVFTSDRTADLKAAKRAEIDAKWKAEFDAAEVQSVEQEKRDSGVVFDMTDAQGEHRIEILNEGEKMSDILLDGAQMEIPTEELNRWKQEAGIQSAENGVQSADAVADDTTDNVAPTGDNVAPVTPVELPDVPDFFRLNGTNYEVASRNDDGSVDVMVNGKRETLPAGTDYSTLMPTDKKGEVQYEKMPVERTHEYFVQRVTNDKKRAEMIDNNRKKAEAERKKFDKEPDAGLDPDKWEEINRKWEEGKKAAQAKVDYWKEVGKREAEITRSETREAVENIKPDVMKETADEFIANQLAGIKITPESFKRETGLSNAEQAQLVGVISNDGVSVERAAEIILENYDSELAGMGFTGDVQDVRDIIISVLSQGNPRSYAKRGREAREAENMDQQRADAEAWAKGAFDMKLEELYLYEETVLPRIVREYEGFDENEYYSNLAENNEYDTTRESESIGRGGELLQGEQSVPAGGTPVVGQRNEGGAVSDDVQGGSQNGVAQEEVPVNEPVGNSEQLSSSEIPNNQSVAEGNAPGQSGVQEITNDERAENEGEIQETAFLETPLDNGDKKITGINSRGEVATVTIERDGKVVSVDSYDEGVLFEHTEYDGNGKAKSVTRYDKQGNVVGTQVYEDGKAKTPMQKLADRILDRTEEKRRIPLRERAKELEAQVGVKANIIESVDEVADPEARRRIVAGQNVAGWYSKGEVYLYMPNLQDRREIELTYVHEVVAHHGVKKLLGKRFNEFLDGVWNMMSEADRARMLAYVGANENPTLQDMRAAADEYVAELAEKMDLNELEQSTWEKIVDWFKKILENIGFENLTKEDIESMLKASYANLRSTEQGAQSKENDFRAKMTFHGSGAKFDRFDHAFMGTGEGAQAFGWGTYVTEVEGIGRTYATVMRDKAISDKHRENAIINNLARQVLASNNGDKNAALEELRNLLNESWSDKKRVKAEIKIIETGKFLPETKVKANLYSVEIPDDNGSNYLHWEDVVPKKVETAVKERLLERLSEGQGEAYKSDLKQELDDVFRYSDFDGASLYKNISAYLGGDKQASLFLNDMGFVGISYPAEATTGGRADGARNYVIFNENDAQIKDRTMFRVSRTPQEFDATQAEAVEKRGIVAPGLNETVVNVVDVPRHDFTGNLKEARAKAKEWAVENYTGKEFDLPENAGKYVISKNAIGKYLDKSAFDKSENAAVHLSVLKELPNVISNSIEAEIHADYSKGVNGERSAENGVNRNDLLVHRIYGAVNIDGKTYRVKTTIHEFRDANTANTPHSYEVTKIELIEDSTVTPNDGINNPLNRSVNSISATKLLEGVEKSYDKGKKVLDESENSSENPQDAESGIRFRKVDDPAKIAELEAGEKIKVYRAMQVIDGKLYPPMSAKVDGKLREPIELGVWEEAEERPELADDKGYFKLDKGNKKSLKARYNPYIHTSTTPLNDQFSEAQERPNLVTVEVEIPVSELTSGYKAEKAKDAVGRLEWKAGVVQGKLSGTRTVILSRWDKPVRIVPDSEVADVIVEMFGDREIVMPSNVVTPSLRAELEKRGVPFVETNNQGKPVSAKPMTKEEARQIVRELIVPFAKELREEQETRSRKVGNTENNSIFASIYKTEDGKDINYTSERTEGYGVQDDGIGNSNNGSRRSILQRQTDTGVPGADSGLDAEKGEFCVVERVFTENGAFNFTSGEKIGSADDVAYIFSALEDAAKEHSFVVYVKDGMPTVVELGMGSFNATMVDVPTASLAYSRINPDHVYFVHNHPSGNLICSSQDVAMLREFEDMSDVPVTGVIINLKTGKYGTFDTERHSVIGEKRVPEKEERLAVHTLDKQIFAPDYDPMAQPLVRGSQDVAQFLNSQRMGDRPKVSFLILSRANRIIGNIHTPFTNITTDVEAVARYINERVIQFGGENAILYGDFAITSVEGMDFRLLQNAMDRFGKTKLLDVVRVEGNFTRSANDMGLLYEPEAEYKEGQTMFRITDTDRQALEFKRQHKGSANIVAIDTDALVPELLAQGFTAEEILKIRKMHEKGVLGFYDRKRNTIYLLGKDHSEKENDATFWHENTHKAIGELDVPQEIMDEFYAMPSKRFIDFFEKKAKEFYEPEEYAEELIAYFVEDVQSNGNYDNVTKALGTTAENMERLKEIVEPIINYINHGRRTNEGTEGNNRTVVRETIGNGDVETLSEGARTEAEGTGETRFSTRGEGIDNVPTQPLTLMERITNSLLEVSAKNKENLELRASALRTFGRDINRVLSLMKAQREYDKSTVDTLVKLAKMYFQNAQLLGEVTPYEVARIMGVLNRSVGKRDISTEAAKLMDILLDAHTNALAGILDKAEKIKAKKVNAAGVEVMGRLDKYGQKRVDEYRAAKGMTPEKLEEAIFDSDNRLAELEQRVREVLGIPDGDVDLAAREYTGDNDVVNVYMDERARLEGLTLAREYKESIQQVQEEIKDLKAELKQAEEDYRLGNIDGKSLKEFRKSVAEAIMESKAELIEGYHNLIYKFQENTKESSQRAKEFAQAQIDRAREIQHNANSDMEGIPADTQGTHPDNHNNAVMNALRSPFPTFQGMLKKFGEKNAEGKGYLYERFMPQATQASDNEFRGKVAARVMIEAKLKEIYGEKANIARFMKELREYGATVTYREGNEMKQFDLTKGQMLYIYMVNKMADGQMKLRRMGITDDVVAGLMVKLPEEAVQFADWAQDVLLKGLRGKYNAVHERVFGAPMAAIENYFPIKIRKEARGEKGDVSEVGQEGKPSTVTGSIIKRTKNATAIDLSADAMQVLMEHIDDMEHWAAFAEFNRDLNVLLNYKHFQNQVKNMTSVRYGSGEEMWKNFKRTAQIVSGTYRPSDLSFDRFVQNITKGVTRAKINFRVFTAIKQLLSTPAFWTDAGVEELAYCYANPKGSFKWAKENLPGFAERWQGRTMGNEKLLKSDSDWEIWRNETVEKATRWGMTPNAFIDALTVAQGARAVYMTKLEQFKKAGYTEQRANEKALQAAAEAYNESQQSSEGVYLSPLQVEGTAMAAMVSTFKNSNFGYTRKTAQAVANIKRKMRKGYKEETIAFMTKQMMRDGLSEDNAKRFAEKVYYKSIYRDAANVAMFGFGLNLLWEAGGMAIYLLLGDDDEEKEKMKEEIAMRAALGVLQGIPFGDTMISAVTAVKEGDSKYLRLPELIAVTDIKNLAQVFDYDTVRAANDVLNILVSMGVGVTPQVFTDVLVAIADIEDFSVEELGMFAARLVNAPQSNLDRLMVDDAMENSAINADEIMRRYAEYKKSKNAPITQFLYPDATEQKALERYMKRFNKMLDERLENVVEDNDAYDLFYKGADARMKSGLAKMRQDYLAEDKAEVFEKMDAKELVERVLYGSGEINEAYFNLSTAEDEDDAFVLKSVLKELDDLVEEGMQTDEEEQLLRGLKAINNAINKAKRLMKQQPDKAQEHMNNIREMRAEAIKQINNYRKNE